MQSGSGKQATLVPFVPTSVSSWNQLSFCPSVAYRFKIRGTKVLGCDVRSAAEVQARCAGEMPG